MFWPYSNARIALPLDEDAGEYLLFPGKTHHSWIELALYLGPAFERDWMHGKDAAIAEEFQACGNPAVFYEQSQRYLYHLTAYFLEGWKQIGYSFLFQAMAYLGRRPSILDYGCGIGSDGLWLLDAGATVNFADFDNPCRAYLAWRLAQRQTPIVSQIYDVTDDIPRHDIVWCMDVLEHLPPMEQAQLLGRLGRLGRFVVMNLVDDKTADGQVHHPVAVEALTEALDATAKSVTFMDMHKKRDGSRVRFLTWEVGDPA